MAFSKQQLQKFAHLIRIDIPDEKLTAMEIDSVIDWLDKLQKIDTKDVRPMLTPVEHPLPMRKDIVSDGKNRDAVLANAPEKINEYFAVPKVIDND